MTLDLAGRSILITGATDFDAVRKATASITALPEYEVSKLANVLFTRECTRRLSASIHNYALHPGVIASDAWRRIPWPVRPVMKMFMLTNEQGALTSMHCATSPEVATHNGRYYTRSEEAPANPMADDESLARTLWEKSAEWTGSPLFPRT